MIVFLLIICDYLVIVLGKRPIYDKHWTPACRFHSKGCWQWRDDGYQQGNRINARRGNQWRASIILYLIPIILFGMCHWLVSNPELSQCNMKYLSWSALILEHTSCYAACNMSFLYFPCLFFCFPCLCCCLLYLYFYFLSLYFCVLCPYFCFLCLCFCFLYFNLYFLCLCLYFQLMPLYLISSFDASISNLCASTSTFYASVSARYA